ncbi:hypothetical protein [Methylotenera sp.]|uniref:hypothetical protein n=1 Tax=Methylotenera sp. TaxID=2051956 RepID=UPI002489DE9A|nr:hypothetical protein [Methylotenera sp.]MDI1298372.1 hypothetical protein [Methylotenera sp.]
MINKRLSLGMLVMVLGVMPTAFADEALKHDPFSRPLLTATTVANTESGAKIEEETPWSPILTAVMLAGKNSLITIDGVIMKLGEVKDGYRLIQVKDHEAIFKKGKKRIVLEIKMGAVRTKTESATGAETILETDKPLLRQNKDQGNTQ